MLSIEKLKLLRHISIPAHKKINFMLLNGREYCHLDGEIQNRKVEK